MLEGNTKPLEIAKRVLSDATLLAVARSPFTTVGWKIVDRWALNSPRELAALEASGLQVLLRRLQEQQTMESVALMLNAGLKDLALSEHEALQLGEIETELR